MLLYKLVNFGYSVIFFKEVCFFSFISMNIEYTCFNFYTFSHGLLVLKLRAIIELVESNTLQLTKCLCTDIFKICYTYYIF